MWLAIAMGVGLVIGNVGGYKVGRVHGRRAQAAGGAAAQREAGTKDFGVKLMHLGPDRRPDVTDALYSHHMFLWVDDGPETETVWPTQSEAYAHRDQVGQRLTQLSGIREGTRRFQMSWRYEARRKPDA